MRRAVQASLTLLAAAGVSLAAAACGTQKITVASTQGSLYTGAVIFNEHCAGCHSLATAAARGSAANVQTREYTNGPNFNVRCERPITRILYAIANGGFSGQIMPQNIVVGQQAQAVANFVANYSGRQAPRVSGLSTCSSQAVGAVPNYQSGTYTGSAVNATRGNVFQTVTSKTVSSSPSTPVPSVVGTTPAKAPKTPKQQKGRGGKSSGG